METIFGIFARIISLFILDRKVRRDIRAYITYLPYRLRIKKLAQKVGENFYIGGPSYLNCNTFIGDNCHFSGVSVNGKGNIKIGNNFRSGSELLIMTQNHRFENSEFLPYDSEFIYKDVEIEDCVWVGARVTILPGTKICEGAIIQAGSVVHGTIPRLAIAGGNPAKVFKYRDAEHYERLKSEGKFYIEP